MKRLIYIGFACGASLALITTLVLLMSAGVRPVAAFSTGSTYIVNSTADTPDIDTGDGVCLDLAGHCTLRAAIMQANFVTGPDTITLLAGVYVLTRAGDDDAAVLGDLDIADSLTILGAGSGTTIIDGNGPVTGDRVVQILSSATDVSLSGMTIQGGRKTNTFDEGGGLYWEGLSSHLNFHDVIFEGNAAYYGGGLYLVYSLNGDVVDMDQVIIHANRAAAAAGGLGVNFGSFAGFDLRNSQVYSNTAYQGGGVYFQVTPGPFDTLSARIQNTQIYSNTASLSAGFENHSGDTAVPVVLSNSHVYHNYAYYGGGIGNYGALAVISTTLDANSASVRGGGLYNYEGGQVTIENSTLSGNNSQYGGGIYSEFFLHNTAALMLTNSTLSGNTASREGGGLYAVGGKTQFFNTTIANNQVVVPNGTFYAGMGGGVYITGTALVSAQDTLLADNSRQIHSDPPVPDDCYATITSLDSLGFNLVETTTNCLISDITAGNITGLDPLLGALRDNGGSTQTQALLHGSPAIDAGQQPFCPDANGSPITTDQRSLTRPAGSACDIGAFEYPGYILFLPTLRR